MSNVLALRIHAAMLADDVRNRQLARAIANVVRPGDVVVDVGAGSGLLSMLAARAGARKVYALEGSRFAGVARALIERNGLSGVIEVLQTSSFDFVPPEPADVVLCETLGFAVFDERFRQNVCDARDRMLRPGGALLPRAVSVQAAPVVAPPEASAIARLDEILGFDFGPLADAVRRLHRRSYVRPACELAASRTVLREDCATMQFAQALRTLTEFTVATGGELGGFAMWFDADLGGGITMSSRSPEPENHWGQAFLPLRESVRVHAGDVATLSLAIVDSLDQFTLRWDSTVRPYATIAEASVA
ncbi:MAG: 50S ribosomal protein L11 methyltransferase [Candidatus Eremiobacteraeota bacterium]|nr:50S ribosomal protein L11 methyltransferase [Candidatus Eremiobacteraeota bacterium]